MAEAGAFFRLGLAGFPLGHSVSPAMHAAALAAAGLQGEHCLYPAPPGPGTPGALGELVERLRAGELDGINVTVPHKQTLLALVDGLTPAAREVGAVNVLYREGGCVMGDNTDAPAFLTDLRAFLAKAGRKPGAALVIGAGGAARAAAWALAQTGWQVITAARRLKQAQALAGELNALPGLAPIQAVALDAAGLAGSGDFDLVVNATPVGMYPRVEESPWPEGAALPAGAAVYDMVYNPAETALVRSARRVGLEATSGMGMLVEQAALSFERWTGKPADRAAMRAAGEAALAARE